MNLKIIKIFGYTLMAGALVLMVLDESWMPWANLIIFPGCFAIAVLERREAIRKHKESEEKRTDRELGLVIYGLITLIHSVLSIKWLLTR